MEPNTITGLKLAMPVLRSGFRAVRRELERRAEEEGRKARLADLDPIFDEALSVLARQADGLWETTKVEVKGLLSRPDVFSYPAPAKWIATELAQECVRHAALAAIRGEDDQAHVEVAISHYRSFFDDYPEAFHPDEVEVFLAALDYLLRSLQREMSPGERVLYQKIESLGDRVEGLGDQIARVLPAENSELADEKIKNLVERLRRIRFFHSAGRIDEAERLAKMVTHGPLRGASSAIRSRALAWCSRIAVFSDQAMAQAWCDEAEALVIEESEEIRIARAFLESLADPQAGLARMDIEGSQMQATAALQILRNSYGQLEGLSKADELGISQSQLDSDGSLALIGALAAVGEWTKALASVQKLEGADYEQTPALMWVAATILVASCLPEPMRQPVLYDIPVNPRMCPLREDAEALDVLRTARGLMDALAETCHSLRLPKEEQSAKRYALWLALEDPEEVGAQAILRERFAGKDGLTYLPLALSSGLEVDVDAVLLTFQRVLGQSSNTPPALHNALTALLVHQSVAAPENAERILESFRSTLESFLDPLSLLKIEIRILIDAGKEGQARRKLSATDLALSPSERAVLESLMADQGSLPDLEALEALYREDPQPGTLIPLVERHRIEGFSSRYLELARELLTKMPTADFAVEIVNFLVSERQDKEAEQMLDLVSNLLDRSEPLLTLAAWLKFRLGNLDDAWRLLEQLEAKRDDQTDRELRLQMLVASGRWDALDGYLEKQWDKRSERDAVELARLGTLSAQTDGKRTLDFAKAAVAIAPENPQVLLAAYMAATTAGLEEATKETSQWLMDAAAYSGEDGPVQQAPIDQLLNGRGDWNERTEKAGEALINGSAPLTMIAATVSRPWLDLLLSPLLLNPSRKDPREVNLRVPFSGFRRIKEGEKIDTDEIAIDAPALVTLASVDALDLLEKFKRIYVPHDLLSDLFEQRSRLSFHQPSRIVQARELLDMISNGALGSFVQTETPDIRLVTQIGVSRAAMLVEAAAHEHEHHVFVHPYPIHRVGSLLSEPVDLQQFAPQLVSTLGVLDYLERNAFVTSSEAAKARAYLSHQDKKWPDEKPIAKGAILYLSDLAIDYLRPVGLLEKIGSSDISAVVSESELEEAKALRDAGTTFQGADRIILRLRATLERMLEEGRVVLTPAAAPDPSDAPGIPSLISLVESAPVLVTDDRFLNRHPKFDLESGGARILATIDVMQMLANGGSLDPDRLEQARITLRSMGAAFVPICRKALQSEVERTVLASQDDPASANKTPKIAETGDLRVLRQNLRQIQAHGWFDPKFDGTWLMEAQSAIVEVIHSQWRKDIAIELSRARSNWLFSLLDSRGWCDLQTVERDGNLAEYGRVVDQSRLATSAFLIPAGSRQEFDTWLESDVLEPAWADEPELKPVLLNHLRGFVRAITRDVCEQDARDERAVAAEIFGRLPKFLQVAMLADAEFQDTVGYTVETEVELGGASFSHEGFLNEVRSLYASPDQCRKIADHNGHGWALLVDHDEPQWLKLTGESGAEMRVRSIQGVHPNASSRIAMFDAFLARNSIANDKFANWRERMSDAALDTSEVEALEEELRALPTSVESALRESLRIGHAAISLLVPSDRRYWDHLVGPRGPATLNDLLEPGSGLLSWCSAHGVERAKWVLLLASHSAVVRADFCDLDQSQRLVLGDWVTSQGDLLAMVGFFELALPFADKDSALEQQLIEIVKKIEALDPDAHDGQLMVFSCLAMFVEGELSRTGTLADLSPWHRRMASMAHAALLCRVTQGSIDTGRFAQFCREQRGWRFLLQSLVDMQSEPRWRTEYMMPSQLRHELLGRIFNATAALPADQIGEALQTAVLSDEVGLRGRLALPMALLPGPLEGGIGDEMQQITGPMQSLLEEVALDNSRAIEFIKRLVNMEGIVRIPLEYSDKITSLIREDGAGLLSALPASEAHAHLLGLANLAASHRLVDLAETLRSLVRLLRLRSPLPLTDELQLALHAAAAHENRKDWREFVGNWIREIAYRLEGADDAEVLSNWIDGLGEIDPHLRYSCGRARAVLQLLLEQ